MKFYKIYRTGNPNAPPEIRIILLLTAVHTNWKENFCVLALVSINPKPPVTFVAAVLDVDEPPCTFNKSSSSILNDKVVPSALVYFRLPAHC